MKHEGKIIPMIIKPTQLTEDQSIINTLLKSFEDIDRQLEEFWNHSSEKKERINKITATEE